MLEEVISERLQLGGSVDEEEVSDELEEGNNKRELEN